MTLPLQVTFRNMKHSDEVENWVRKEAEKLETFYHRIIGCRVAIEVPHRHHRKGKALHVRIDLTLPGKEIVITHEPVAVRRNLAKTEVSPAARTKPESLHSDMELAIHEAFKAAGRRVKDFARRQRGEVKSHDVILVEVRNREVRNSQNPCRSPILNVILRAMRHGRDESLFTRSRKSQEPRDSES